MKNQKAENQIEDNKLNSNLYVVNYALSMFKKYLIKKDYKFDDTLIDSLINSTIDFETTEHKKEFESIKVTLVHRTIEEKYFIFDNQLRLYISKIDLPESYKREIANSSIDIIRKISAYKIQSSKESKIDLKVSLETMSNLVIMFSRSKMLEKRKLLILSKFLSEIRNSVH